MNVLDLLIVLLAVLGALWGALSGIAIQAGSYGGLFVGVLVGAVVAQPLSSLVSSPLTKIWLSVVTVLGFAFAFTAVGELVGVWGARLLDRVHLSVLDSVGGAVVGVAAQLLVVWMLAVSLSTAPLGGLGDLIRGSKIIDGLDQVMPPVPSVMAHLGRLLDPLGLPSVFAGIGRSPSQPVAPPSTAAVQGAARVQASILKIEGRGCGGILEGSGFVAAPGLVVTNAHVVAGIARPVVVDRGSFRQAVPVVFDPSLDIAVLRVGGLVEQPLTLDVAPVPRGTGGAVLGYPGGGALTIVPAAIRDTYRAQGRDIYNDGLVTRDVEELQTQVRPGNSGGPFVLPDGTVAGVVFGRSLTESGVGYALTSAEIRPAVSAAQARTAPVSTGGCAAD